MTQNQLFAFLVTISFLLNPAIHAQEPSALSTENLTETADEERLFVWNVLTPEIDAIPDMKVTLRVSLTVAPDHIVYADRTSVRVAAPSPFQASNYPLPPTHQKTDPQGELVDVFTGEVEFAIPIVVPQNTEPGIYRLPIHVEQQGCSPTICYFPFEAELAAILRVSSEDGTVNMSEPVAGPIESVTDTFVPAPSQPQPPEKPTPTVSETTPDTLEAQAEAATQESQLAARAAEGGLPALLGIFLAGLITAFTPCVYPLIPITLGIFGARQTKSRFQAFLLSATYVLGIALMYTTLGVVISATGAVFGEFMADPKVVGVVALFLLAFGLSMLGLFEIQLPAAFRDRVAHVGGAGYGSAFVMGLVSGIVAAPCTGPMLGGILLYAAQSQDAVRGGMLLFLFALGLGSPFLLLGTFSNLIQKAPKAGPWMEHIKHVLAIMLFAAALYVVKDAFPAIERMLRPVPEGVMAGLVLILVGAVLGGVHRSVVHGSALKRTMALAGVVALSVGCYLAAGALTVHRTSDLPWIELINTADDFQTRYEETLQSAREQGKPVVIDFTANWCNACKELDGITFAHPEIHNLLQTKFVLLRIDLTETQSTPRWLKEQYRIIGLPLVTFLNSAGQEVVELRLTGFERPESFKQRLDRF